MPKRLKAPRVPEREIQRAIQQWCRASGVLHWRMPLAGVVQRRGDGSAFLGTNGLTGFPDLAGVRPDAPGALWVCEVKGAGGRLRPAQKDWRLRLMRAGVLYILAYSLEEFVEALKSGKSNPGRLDP